MDHYLKNLIDLHATKANVIPVSVRNDLLQNWHGEPDDIDIWKSTLDNFLEIFSIIFAPYQNLRPQAIEQN